MSNLPSGTVTFLFTDIERSTPLWQDHPDTMQSALAHHNALIRSAIEVHNGHVVKTSGDGFMAVFPTPQQGVAAALEMQLALQRADWSAETPIRVRIGLHTGMAEVNASDYIGHEVNRAARIQGAAHPHQVLLSQPLYELIHHCLPLGVTL
ncbi:MAG TPA: adenylate/guanylate cyclase domain-containing protein, partial [Chthonomonadaceae bacterium]|nr:adenylate/guanylate cyclase domain-containing protein [Chthonomonadaceae bacterium]